MNKRSFQCIPALTLLLAILGCNSSALDNLAATATTVPAAPAGVQSPVPPADIIHPSESLRNLVFRDDARLPLRDSTAAAASPWSSSDSCRDGSKEQQTGGGKRHFYEAGPGCTLMRHTDIMPQADGAMSLLFALSADRTLAVNESVTLSATLLSVDSEGRQVELGTGDFTIDGSATDWRTQQLLVDFGQSEAPAASTLAVKLGARADNSVSIFLDDLELASFQRRAPDKTQFSDSWAGSCDQKWVGENWWANRIHDWHVTDGRLQTRHENSAKPLRTVHRVGSMMSASPEPFELSVRTGTVTQGGNGSFSGVLLGAGTSLDYRAAALVHNRHGRNGGVMVVVDSAGFVSIRDNGSEKRILDSSGSVQQRENAVNRAEYQLKLTGEYARNNQYRLNAVAYDSADRVVGSATALVPAGRLLGNIALVSNPGVQGTGHWFESFTGNGAKLVDVPARRFGPVLMTTYTVSRDELTLNAQFPQLCIDGYSKPVLSVVRDGQWVPVATTEIDPQAYTARFNVNGWSNAEPVPYRVEIVNSRTGQMHEYHGSIKANPLNADDFTIATYNCRPGVLLSDTEGWIQQNSLKAFTWSAERIAYPHSELMRNAAVHKPDLMAFLGDQIYEFDPNGFIDKRSLDALIDDYFWKWQQFVWTVREYTRVTPAFIIPDDHDVFQGNIWGAGGGVAVEESDGGYVYPLEFINIVQKTQTGSLPTNPDQTIVGQGIATYYTDIVYGGVGMAVIEDRKFKNAPGNADQRLLGEKQLGFLDKWARDWQDQSLKLVFSQSPFAQSTSHSGKNANPIGHDLDSNGWPKQGRDSAVTALRRALAPHVSGDQHLAMSLQHGIEAHNDAVHSFAGPSMLNIFPRIWDPLNAQAGPGDPADAYTGKYTDKHGNLIDVLAAANPESYYMPDLKTQSYHKDQLGIGYGIVKLDKPQREYEFSAWPASVNPSTVGAVPYPGWPIRVQQDSNDGRLPAGYLPGRTAVVDEPVVTVVDESSGELIYAKRYNTPAISLPVFDRTRDYRVTLSDDASGYLEEFTQQRVVQ